MLAQARSSKLPLPFVRQRSRLACNAGSCINLIAALNRIAGRTPAQVSGLANDMQYKKLLANVL